MSPIKVEQTTLIKYLPGFKINPLTTDDNSSCTDSIDSSYTLRMTPDRIIYIKDTHCVKCGRRLVGNGHNPRVAILDMGRGKREFRIHRKRCKRCGEVRPDYSKIAPKYGNFHENYKRRARQHYMEGLMPSQIKRVFRIDFGVEISISTIVNWIGAVAASLRKTLKETPVPSSGYWGYDEIHLKVAGNKMYAINTVDVNTRFVPVAKISERMGRKVGREVLLEGKRGKALPLLGLTKDCTTNLGGLFKTRNFKNVIQQNCLTHVKWIASKHSKAFAGLPTRSTKPIPKQWRWLLKRFYNLIDAKNEADAYIQLEIVRRTVERLKGRKIKNLNTALKQIESWLPKIIPYKRNPLIAATNNLCEGFHKKYEYYPMFKTQMMTSSGAQRVLDYRVFGHNFRRFPVYIEQYELKRERWRALLRDSKGDPILRGQANHFAAMFRKLDRWYGSYLRVWDEFFAIKLK